MPIPTRHWQSRLPAGLDVNDNLVVLHARLSEQSILAYLAPSQSWTKQELGYNSIPIC